MVGKLIWVCCQVCKHPALDDFVPMKVRVRKFFQRWPGAMKAGHVSMFTNLDQYISTLETGFTSERTT